MNNLQSCCYSLKLGLIRQFSNERVTARPAVMFVAGIVSAISIYYNYLPLYSLLLLLILPFFKRAGILFFLFGMFAGLISSCASEESSDLRKYFSRHNKFVDMDIEITDRRLSMLPNLHNPSLIIADTRYHYLNNKRIICSGKVMLKFPEGEKIPEYGSIINIQGVLRDSSASAYIQCGKLYSPGFFELVKIYNPFKEYIESKNIHHTLYVKKFRILKHQAGFWSKILFWRDKILQPLTKNLTSSECDLAAGFFLGATGGLTQERKSSFISSGTVHLFAVSGLHIGLMALLLKLLFHTSSYRINSLIIGIIVWAYVIFTGANPPAIRAGGMISVLCLLRFFRKFVPNIDAWAIFAAVILLISPRLLSDIGFLYSFTITLVIIYIARWRQSADDVHYSLGNLIKEPRKRKKFMKQFKFMRNIKWSFLSAIVVFLAGAGISIAAQSMFLPGAILANIVILPFLPLFFLFALGKIVIEVLCPFFSTLATIPLSKAFSGLEKTAEFFAESSCNIPVIRPTILEVILYYTGLLWFMVSVKKKWIGIVTLCLISLVWIAGAKYSSNRLLIISTDSATPISIAIQRNSKHSLELMNVPSVQHANAINHFCRKFGIRKINFLTVDKLKNDRTAGLDSLNRNFLSWNQIYLPLDKKSILTNISYEKFLNNIKNIPFLKSSIIQTADDVPISAVSASNRENLFRVKISSHAAAIPISVQNMDDGKKITVEFNNQIMSAVCPYSNIATVLELPFKTD